MSRFLTQAASALVALAALNGAPAVADDVFVCEDFDEGNVCAGVPQSLRDAGMNPDDASQLESSAVMFAGAEGTATVTFKFVEERGEFEFSFGMCNPANVDSGAVDAIRDGSPSEEEQKAFAVGCIENGRHIFDDLARSEGAMEVESGIDVPSDVVFYLIPNGRKDTFLGNPDEFYSGGDRRAPLFSWADANPGYFDQLLMFTDATNTVFLWEDKTRAGETDVDFNDLVFDLDVVLMPMIPGCSQQCVALEYDPTAPSTTYTVNADDKCVCVNFGCPEDDDLPGDDPR